MKFFLAILLFAVTRPGADRHCAAVPVHSGGPGERPQGTRRARPDHQGPGRISLSQYSGHHPGRPHLQLLSWSAQQPRHTVLAFRTGFLTGDRIELTKQRDVIYVYQGDKGYEITYKGALPQDRKDLAEYLRRRHFSLDWVLRKWLSEPGSSTILRRPDRGRGKTSRASHGHECAQ